MIGFPFDSHVEFDENGTPVYDRAITAEPYRKLLKELFKTGINPTLSSTMQVSSGTDMNVIVHAGFAIVEGCMKLEESDRTLAVQASDSTYDRIDTVVLRLDDNDDMRICDFYVVKGTPSANPVHPALTREGSIYEIGLADLFITKNATQISADKITDTRYDDERCGVMSSISEFDTETLNAQMNAWSAQQRVEFSAWVESIKDILDESTAGHLQNEIDAINASLADVAIALASSQWTERDDGNFTQTVTVNGITENNAPLIALSPANDVATDAERTAFSLLRSVTTSEDAITFIASAQPQASITVIAKSTQATATSVIGDLSNLSAEVTEINNNLNDLKEKAQRGEFGMPLLDYGNPIFSFTTSQLTYTATEDCWLYGEFVCNWSANGYLSINGVKVVHAYPANADYGQRPMCERLTTGDTVTLTSCGHATTSDATLHVMKARTV